MLTPTSFCQWLLWGVHGQYSTSSSSYLHYCLLKHLSVCACMWTTSEIKWHTCGLVPVALGILLVVALFLWQSLLCSPACPGCCFVYQAILQLRNPPASLPECLKVCATTPGLEFILQVVTLCLKWVTFMVCRLCPSKIKILKVIEKLWKPVSWLLCSPVSFLEDRPNHTKTICTAFKMVREDMEAEAGGIWRRGLAELLRGSSPA